MSYAATQHHDDIWAWAATATTSGFMALLQPGSLLMSLAPDSNEGHVNARDLAITWEMVVSKGHSVTGAMLIRMACIAICCQGDIWAQAAEEDFVWVCGPTTPRVYVDVCGLCSTKGHADVWGLG